jgi:hypothetical protein
MRAAVCALLASLLLAVTAPKPVWAREAPAAASERSQAGRGDPSLALPGATGARTAPAEESRAEYDDTRPSRSLILRRLSRAARAGSADGWYWGMAGMTLALAICGGLVATARRFFPQGAAGGIHIVSRVSLSPKHTLHVLRIGRRVLLVGSGPQGPPALLSELDDASEFDSSRRHGEET